MSNPQRNLYRGALLGLAVGDAVGTTLEFEPPGSFQPIDDMVGGGPFELEAGQWTDDTSMALCLAASLVERRGFDATDQMDRYVRWWRHGYLSSTGDCFDIGSTVSDALLRYERTGDPFSGSKSPYSAGNGSIMRPAPVPLFFAENPKNSVEYSALSSKTTHGTVEAVDACKYFGGLLAGAVRGLSKSDLLSADCYDRLSCESSAELSPKIQEITGGSFKGRQPPDIKGSGYVVASLEAALWAFDRSNTFRGGCLLAANLGDDADTTAAVYGQLAGAFYGASGIPPDWLAKLHGREMIESMAKQLWSERKVDDE
jgi:ADP-ribosylglycohydrolase